MSTCGLQRLVGWFVTSDLDTYSGGGLAKKVPAKIRMWIGSRGHGVMLKIQLILFRAVVRFWNMTTTMMMVMVIVSFTSHRLQREIVMVVMMIVASALINCSLCLLGVFSTVYC